MRGAAVVTHRLGAGGWAERRGAAAETRFTSARVSRAWRDGRSCPGSGSLAPARARPIPLERSAVASPRQRGRRRSDAPRSAPMAPTTTMRDWRTRPGGSFSPRPMEYSSLAALLQFPVAALKIDRSLVTSLIGHGGRSEAIVRGAIALAHGLGLRAIAEGTEHPIELDCLRHSTAIAVKLSLLTAARRRTDPGSPRQLDASTHRRAHSPSDLRVAGSDSREPRRRTVR